MARISEVIALNDLKTWFQKNGNYCPPAALAGAQVQLFTFAGTRNCVQFLIQFDPIASLAWLGKEPPCPLQKLTSRADNESLVTGVHTHRKPGMQACRHDTQAYFLSGKDTCDAQLRLQKSKLPCACHRLGRFVRGGRWQRAPLIDRWPAVRQENDTGGALITVALRWTIIFCRRRPCVGRKSTWSLT